MIKLGFDLQINTDLVTARAKRKMNKALKPALKEGLRLWYKKYLPKHFTRQAYILYSKEYGNARKKSGEPLVVTGNLKEQVTGQVPRIIGTSAKASIGLQFGRPAQYKGEELRRAVVQWLRKNGREITKSSYREAEAAILSSGGYGRQQKQAFKKRIEAIHPGEEKEIKDFVANKFMKIWKTLLTTKERTKIGI